MGEGDVNEQVAEMRPIHSESSETSAADDVGGAGKPTLRGGSGDENSIRGYIAPSVLVAAAVDSAAAVATATDAGAEMEQAEGDTLEEKDVPVGGGAGGDADDDGDIDGGDVGGDGGDTHALERKCSESNYSGGGVGGDSAAVAPGSCDSSAEFPASPGDAVIALGITASSAATVAADTIAVPHEEPVSNEPSERDPCARETTDEPAEAADHVAISFAEEPAAAAEGAAAGTAALSEQSDPEHETRADRGGCVPLLSVESSAVEKEDGEEWDQPVAHAELPHPIAAVGPDAAAEEAKLTASEHGSKPSEATSDNGSGSSGETSNDGSAVSEAASAGDRVRLEAKAEETAGRSRWWTVGSISAGIAVVVVAVMCAGLAACVLGGSVGHGEVGEKVKHACENARFVVMERGVQRAVEGIGSFSKNVQHAFGVVGAVTMEQVIDVTIERCEKVADSVQKAWDDFELPGRIIGEVEGAALVTRERVVRFQDAWRASLSGRFHGIDPYRGIEGVKQLARETGVCMADALVRLQDMLVDVFPGYFRPSESKSIATDDNQDDKHDGHNGRAPGTSEPTDVGSFFDGNGGMTAGEGALVTMADGIGEEFSAEIALPTIAVAGSQDSIAVDDDAGSGRDADNAESSASGIPHDGNGGLTTGDVSSVTMADDMDEGLTSDITLPAVVATDRQDTATAHNDRSHWHIMDSTGSTNLGSPLDGSSGLTAETRVSVGTADDMERGSKSETAIPTQRSAEPSPVEKSGGDRIHITPVDDIPGVLPDDALGGGFATVSSSGSARPGQPVQVEGPRHSARSIDVSRIVEDYGDVRQDDVERWRELAAALHRDFQDLPGGKCYEDDEEAMEDWKEFREVVTSRRSSAPASTSASTSAAVSISPTARVPAGERRLEGVPGDGDHRHEPVRSGESSTGGVAPSLSLSSYPLFQAEVQRATRWKTAMDAAKAAMAAEAAKAAHSERIGGARVDEKNISELGDHRGGSDGEEKVRKEAKVREGGGRVRGERGVLICCLPYSFDH